MGEAEGVAAKGVVVDRGEVEGREEGLWLEEGVGVGESVGEAWTWEGDTVGDLDPGTTDAVGVTVEVPLPPTPPPPPGDMDEEGVENTVSVPWRR